MNHIYFQHSTKLPSTVSPLQEPFLIFAVNSELSSNDPSAIFCSLVALVKAEFPFNKPLQNKAVQFLRHLTPLPSHGDATEQLVSVLVPSSIQSPSSFFLESILTLLSSPHSTVVSEALSLIHQTTKLSYSSTQLHLVESDFIANIFAIVQPQTLPISENETMLKSLVNILIYSLDLAFPSTLRILEITAAVEKYNHHNMILQKVVIPSSQFLKFLIKNRYMLNGDLVYLMNILGVFLEIGPFSTPILEYVLASPIVMAFSSCLSLFEEHDQKWATYCVIINFLKNWKKARPEVVKSGKRIVQALFSEGFENTLEQLLFHTFRDLLQVMGANVNDEKR
ncbi:hypothetical protein BLNAU_18815 [Blattamonas nauphoetae]|uniref:Uncharacterized protein n=1 Tax=Blattamonas nauphoetae TaxID=2049346 RepID=A0ABQ9X3F3_9EUKA|nr:hypothetical protein BLNAU_18815 [Blattamonas nauphoetae]